MGSCDRVVPQREPDGDDYRAAISQAELVLSGRTKELTEELTRRMEARKRGAALRERRRTARPHPGHRRPWATASASSTPCNADTDASASIAWQRPAWPCSTTSQGIWPTRTSSSWTSRSSPTGRLSVPSCVSIMPRARAWPKFILLPDCMADEDLAALSELFSKESGKKVRVEGTSARGQAPDCWTLQ